MSVFRNIPPAGHARASVLIGALLLVLAAPALRADPPDNIDRFPVLRLVSATEGELVYSISIQYRLSLYFLDGMDRDRDQYISEEERDVFQKKTLEKIRRAQWLTVDGRDVELRLAWGRVLFPEYEQRESKVNAEEYVVARETRAERQSLPRGMVAPLAPQYMRIVARLRFDMEADRETRHQVDYVDRFNYATPGIRRLKMDPETFPVADRKRDRSIVSSGAYKKFRVFCRFVPPKTASLGKPGADSNVGVEKTAPPAENAGDVDATALTFGGTASRRKTRSQAKREGLILNFLHRLAREKLSGWEFVTLLLFCLIYGAFHALAPGHGKTLVASYLVGKQGRFSDVLMLTGAVTVTHTLTIWIMLGGYMFVESGGRQDAGRNFDFWIRVGAAVLTMVMGLWLMADWVRRGASGEDGAHSHGFFAHSHGPMFAGSGGVAGTDGRGLSRRQTILAGILGGAVPCPFAFTVATMCVTYRIPKTGMLLTVFFSLGLAAMLFALGLVVVFSKSAAGRAGKENRALKLLARYVPVPAFTVIIIAGVFLLGITLQDHEIVDLPWLRNIQESLTLK